MLEQQATSFQHQAAVALHNVSKVIDQCLLQVCHHETKHVWKTLTFKATIWQKQRLILLPTLYNHKETQLTLVGDLQKQRKHRLFTEVMAHGLLHHGSY